MTTYNKLVRDRIPQMLEEAGTDFQVETLNHDRFIIELRKKLNEEMMEYQDAASDEEALAELADMLEVIQNLAKVHNGSMEEVEELRKQRLDEHGGFEDKQYLMDVEE